MSRRVADARAEFFVLSGALALVAVPGVFNIVEAGSTVVGWYRNAPLPWYAVPYGWGAFGWTVAYVAMAFAMWLAWREAGWPAIRGAAALWLVQLAGAVVWAFLMFTLHRTGWALAAIGVQCLAAAGCVWLFRRPSPLAALLMLACLGWAGYAGLVDFAIWRPGP